MDIKHLTWIRDQNIIETTEFDQQVNTKQPQSNILKTLRTP